MAHPLSRLRAAMAALGELDLAAATTHHAVDLTGALAPGIAGRYRERLAPYRRQPVIRRALDRLDHTAPR
ncbi:hypothetical protein ACFWA9_05595 [Kitasatospora sp. NPDC059973]|uniref:hypothetical protein n=1 Tax=Kitasatospora sp. NPDC059973 TaxID=3347020 RepID=UPI0036C5E344